MNIDKEYEYKTHSGNLAWQTCRRIIVEIFFLAILAVFFWSNWSNGLPSWLEISVLLIFSSYILIGLALYRKAKDISETFAVYLLDNALGFSGQQYIRQIPYCDLKISKVVKKNGKVFEIHLKTTFNQNIKLQGLVEMEDLSKNLHVRVKTL